MSHQASGIEVSIKDEYAHCLTAWGIDSLPPLSGIKALSSENWRSSSIGLAYSLKSRKSAHVTGMFGEAVYVIELIMPYFRAERVMHGMAEAQRQLRETIIHELAHVCCYHRGMFNEHHGGEWKHLMYQAGYEQKNRFLNVSCAAWDEMKANPSKYCK